MSAKADQAKLWGPHDPQGEEIFRRAAIAAAVLEVVILFVVGWREHWLAHRPPAGLDESRFIDAQVFQLPKQEAHLVQASAPEHAAPKRETAISTRVTAGRKAAKAAPEDAKNETRSGPALAPTHGPVALYAPSPVIPSYLRDANLKTSVVIDFYVSAQGAVMPRLAGSSGNEELDALALEAAAKWQFRPAENNHQAVDSKVRLRIVFEVQ